MKPHIHGITLNPLKCTGCTNCIKLCPTEAIRVKNGKAKIIEEKCIHCGTCLHVCPFNAFTGITHDLKDIFQYPYKIALLDPVLYSQFSESISPSKIIDTIRDYGFDDVYDLSMGSHIITEFTKNHIEKNPDLSVISSVCPAILRLIQLRFHGLIKNILPIISPAEIVASIIRKKAIKELNLSDREIGIFYISPCTAQIFNFQYPLGKKTSNVNGVLSIKSLFLMISKNLKAFDNDTYFTPSGDAIDWARVEGESKSLGIREYLAIDGIENVVEVLEEIESNKIKDLRFIECRACTNGCVGGCLTVENPFVAMNRVRRLAEKYDSYPAKIEEESFDNFLFSEPIPELYATKLDLDFAKAIEKLMEIEKVLELLPQIDCGACGSPSCRALAEDIVLGHAKLSDCMVDLKYK